jgi:O-acetyl-ADP-ribose deacetylase (regulator of RNase III)
VELRGKKLTPSGRTLSEYANLFFEPKNAMLLRVLNECSQENGGIVILGIKKSIVDFADVLITNGLAARNETQFFHVGDIERVLGECEAALTDDLWDGNTKGKRMAECLVPDYVPPEYIQMIYTPDDESKERLQQIAKSVGRSDIRIIQDNAMFFRPSKFEKITDKLLIRNGNMFLSKMQTLTISVNCVGVMGKGLASMTRDLFPDVYGVYRGLCKNGTLQLGQPYLYKRNESYELLDSVDAASPMNHHTWFLLFPTKYHWKDNASYEGIENGLAWLVKTCRNDDIKSMALPALGCGLGNLDWNRIKDMMIAYLIKLDIPIEIYSPA